MSKFQEYLPIYEGDRFCLMCGQACPVRRVTKSEATSPHGWALLVSSLQRGLLPWNAETVDVLYRCADCGNCQGNCATDRPLPYAIQAARDEAVRAGHAPAAVKAMDEKLRAWGNPYGETGDAPQVTGNTVLFVGDAAHFLKPQLVEAAEKLLGVVHIKAARFGVGRSSGYLPYTLGLWETARAMAQQVADDLRATGAVRVITLSTHDAHTLKHVYAELGVALADGLRVTTLVEVLADAEGLNLTPRSEQPYTYHDPSQAIRLPHYGVKARALAAWAMGTLPREMLYRENLATPIGTSGGLEYTQPALAATLARTRLAEAKATGAEILLTDNPLDTATLEKYAEGIQVLNLYQVLAEQVTSKSEI